VSVFITYSKHHVPEYYMQHMRTFCNFF